MKHFFTAKKVALLSVLTAAALITFMIESLFPPLFVVGAKMGLSNIFTLFALIVLGFPCALILLVVKCCLGCLFIGNLFALVYSLAGGLAALAVMTLLRLTLKNKISVVALSIGGAVTHNIAQNLVFCAVYGSAYAVAYLPYLALIGILSGAIVGVAVCLCLRYLPKRLLSDLA